MDIGGGGNGDDGRRVWIKRSRRAHEHPCPHADRLAHGARGADPAAVGVIRAWSTALRRGDVAAAASYFALPSEFINGPTDAVSIHSHAQARAANASLPCGAVLISAVQRGRFVSALFRLTDRPGSNADCGLGAGGLARTNFLIADGRIVDWIRAPGARAGPPPVPVPPPTQGGGPVV